MLIACFLPGHSIYLEINIINTNKNIHKRKYKTKAKKN
jgi:hypothetical protein